MRLRRAVCAISLACGLVAVGVACSSASSTSPAGGTATATASIGPAGGTVQANGLVLDVPAGALDEDVTIAVSVDSASPGGFHVDGSLYRFAPAGLVFAKDVSVTFPTGSVGESVYWTVAGDESRFEALATELRPGHAVARIRHFSEGFVGGEAGSASDGARPPADGAPSDDAGDASDASDAGPSVTCITKRRVYIGGDAGCSQSTTIEDPVHLWLVESLAHEAEGAISTDSPGIQALANNTTLDYPFFNATDATHTLYTGLGSGASDPGMGTIHRTGTVASFTIDEQRFGSPPPGCETVPAVAVTCSGTTTLGK